MMSWSNLALLPNVLYGATSGFIIFSSRMASEGKSLIHKISIEQKLRQKKNKKTQNWASVSATKS